MPSYAPDRDGLMNTGATPERLNDKIVMRAERPRLERVPKSRRRPEFRRRPEPPAIGRPDTRVVRGAGAQGKCRTANVDIIDNNQAWFAYVRASEKRRMNTESVGTVAKCGLHSPLLRVAIVCVTVL